MSSDHETAGGFVLYANQLGVRCRVRVRCTCMPITPTSTASWTPGERGREDPHQDAVAGVVIPDITFQLAKANDDMYLFSLYDVERVYGVPFADVNVTDKYHEMVNDKRFERPRSRPASSSRLAELQF